MTQSQSRAWYAWIIVGTVYVLIPWTYITYILNIIVPAWQSGSYFFAIFWFLAATFMGFLISYSYLLCIITHPGTVPDSYKLSQEELEKNNTTSTDISHDTLSRRKGMVELTSQGKVRICKFCRVRKPDRAHHCRKCGQCILKMDHHCWWFNNCIGYRNYKFFYLFLFYITVSEIFYAITGGSEFINIFLQPIADQFMGNDINLLINYIMNLIFGVALVVFVIYHTKLILCGTTTLESLEKDYKMQQQHNGNPYDLGFKRNWRAIFGENLFYWFIPTQRSVIGDGLKYETRMRVKEMGEGLIHDYEPMDEIFITSDRTD
jgi:ribosomal protein L40E